ncbi:hypothetical protein ASZ90_016751 [hydrocarbon metagenome]|uniref:Uncharacterized protein n=1 Tax=hydrocarbon metagenome TaxID=938273 RepID=A0A0W8EEW9_9ZZZZ
MGCSRHPVGFPGCILRVIVRVRDRAEFNLRWRPEPGAVVPPAIGVDPGEITGVLDRHVDVGVPQVAGVRRSGSRSPVPGRVLCREGILIDEGPVLDDQGDPDIREDLQAVRVHPGIVGSLYHVLIDLVCQQVPGSLACVDIEPGDTVRMVMVEHQTCTLLVGIVEGQDPLWRVRSAVQHIGDIVHTHSTGVIRILPVRGCPLVRSTITDPRGCTTVKVKGCPVLGVIEIPARGHIHLERTHPCSHDGLVDRDEQVAVRSRGEIVDKPDPDRLVRLCHDKGSEVMELVEGGSDIYLAVSAQAGCGEVRVQLLIELPEFDLVVITAHQ